MNCLRHGVLLVFGAPLPAYLLTGQEHGRTIPLADITFASCYRGRVLAGLQQCGFAIFFQAFWPLRGFSL
jgi:hypothetical protein